jgi:hypothetical protein
LCLEDQQNHHFENVVVCSPGEYFTVSPAQIHLGPLLHQIEKLAIVYATPPLSPSAQRTALEAPLANLKGRSTGMDSNDRRQRQSNPSGYASQQGLIQSSPQYPATSSADRFRQSQLAVQSPTSAPTTGRGGNIPGYTYPYGEGAPFSGSTMNAAPLQYPEYPQESQRSQQQQQQYPQYGSNIMYNVPSQPSASPQSPYETVQPYQQPRQTAAIEVLSTNFGVPQQYYVAGGEGGPTSVPNSAIPGQNVPSQYTPLSYTTQSPVGREPLASAYATGMADPNQNSPQAGYGQPAYGGGAQADAALDNAYGQYQTELRRTFECVRDGRLAEAGNSLIHISDWLLGNAEALGKFHSVVSSVDEQLILTIGLVRDDEGMHGERLKLWEEFNTCWLSALQKQKEMSLAMLDTGQRPHPPQSLLESDQMENMGKELVRLCDIMEKHGLVDYQMGVWEEEIVTRKLSLLLNIQFKLTISKCSTLASICSKSIPKLHARIQQHHLPQSRAVDDALLHTFVSYIYGCTQRYLLLDFTLLSLCHVLYVAYTVSGYNFSLHDLGALRRPAFFGSEGYTMHTTPYGLRPGNAVGAQALSGVAESRLYL